MSHYNLLCEDNAKTPKGEKSGYKTGILYLAPNTLSGHQMCPSATPGCIASCLYYSGHGAFSKVQQARIRKTIQLKTKKLDFMSSLYADLDKLVRRAARFGMKPAVRLNGTSDISWEKEWPAIFSSHEEVQFYDYTKIIERMKAFVRGKFPPNYHLTFSLTPERFKEYRYVDTVKRFLKKGGNASFVYEADDGFRGFCEAPALWPTELTELLQASPLAWIQNGDEDDLRFTEKGALIALKAKGIARKDTSGFVIRL